MSLTVTLTSSQPCLLALQVIAVRGAAAAPVGQTATGLADLFASMVPGGSGSLVLGCGYVHNSSAPAGETPYDSGSQVLADLIASSLHEAVMFGRVAADTVAGVPVTTGCANSGLQTDRELAMAEILAAPGGITTDPASPPPVPAPGTNWALGGATTSRTTAPFTPDPSSVLVALGVGNFGSGAALLASDSAGTYTWSHPAAVGVSGNAWINVGVPPAPPPAGTGTATVHLAGSGTGAKHTAGSGAARLALASPGHGAKRTSGGGLATVTLSAAGITAAATPQIVAGSRTLMIAAAVLSQQGWAHRLPDVQAGQPVWVNTRQAAGLVASGLAFYAPAATPLPPAEPPWTAAQMPGAGAGTTNTSH